MKTREPGVPARCRAPGACVVGILACLFCYVQQGGHGAFDFSWALEGARVLLAGGDPYRAHGLGPTEAMLFYPLPTLWFAALFTPLPVAWAGPVFMGLSSGLLAFGLTRRGWCPLITFLSWPYVNAAVSGQWSPLVAASFVVPWLYPLFMLKPSLGLAGAAGFPRARGIIAGAAIMALSIAVWPGWPLEWIENVRGGPHLPPVVIIPGQLLIFSALFRRLPSGRLLFVFSLVPQFLQFYDQVLLFLIPRTAKQYAALSGASWIVFAGFKWLAPLVFPRGHQLRAPFVWDISLDLFVLSIVAIQYIGWERIQEWMARRGLRQPVPAHMPTGSGDQNAS